MTVVTEHSAQHVNVLSIGCREGNNIGAPDQANNWQRMNYYLQRGVGLYFPPGVYEISSALAVTDVDFIAFWGDNAILQQVTNGTRLIDIRNCQSVLIDNMGLSGAYNIRRSLIGVTWDSEANIYLDNCDNVRITNNVSRGYEGTGIYIRGGQEIYVAGNHCSVAGWQDAGGTSSDIQLSTSTAGDKAKDIIIQGNHCCSNTLMGIATSLPTQKLLIANNICVTRDNDGNELTSYSSTLRKSCIEVQYHVSPGLGNTEQDDSNYEISVMNNIVQGCRFGGISAQANPRNGDHPSGFRGVIANNQIRYSCLEQSTIAEDYVINGIFIDQFRDAVVSNNIIVDVAGRSNSGASQERNGIAVGSINPRTPNPPWWTEGGQSVAQCVISNNIIKRVEGVGIRASGKGAEIIINGNAIHEPTVQALVCTQDSGTLDRFGELTIANNRFTRLQGDHAVPFVDLRGDSQKVVANNYFEATGTYSALAPILQFTNDQITVTGNRIKGRTDNTFCRGISFNFSFNDRYRKMILANNQIEDCYYGMAGNSTVAQGVVVGSNNAFVNCIQNVINAQYFAGGWAYTAASNLDTTVRLEAGGDAVPTQGDFVRGDIIWNVEAASGQPMGWLCTATGNPGTWAPMANIP